MAQYKQGVISNLDAAEEMQSFYRQHLDIFIEDAFPPMKLTQDQHVIARAIGNCSDIKIVQSRGAGKTWLTAICCHAQCCLYPGTLVAVASGTKQQATLVLRKLKLIADQNPNVARELTANNARSLVQISGTSSKAMYKNGSSIESFAIESMRGQRAKIVVIDECPEVNQDDQDAIVSPLKNFRRDISFNYGFKDFPSKTISITSACEKSNPFYNEFIRVVKGMAKGDKECFACALDYNAAVRNGITDMAYFMNEKEKLPSLVFDMEYGSKFVGANTDTAFPYELVSSCRTLERIELEQPKNSKSRYVIGLDIATSDAKNADNSILSVIKFIERADGSFAKKLVYLRSFHGETLDVLAEELRKLYHSSFPNVEKIVYDARGLGDSLDRFQDGEYVDVATGKEYPPLVVDDKPNSNSAAIQILHPFRAVQSLNQRIYLNLRVAQEKHTIELPASSRLMVQKDAANDNKNKKLTMEQMAVFTEADALQIEMGNIVARVGASGNVLYDVPRQNMHKDRYSSVAMCNDYVCELEKENIRAKTQGDTCVGVVDTL